MSPTRNVFYLRKIFCQTNLPPKETSMEKILASPINSYLTADLNSRESGNMEDNIALIKAELLPLKSFVMDELYSLSRNMDQIKTEYDQ